MRAKFDAYCQSFADCVSSIFFNILFTLLSLVHMAIWGTLTENASTFQKFYSLLLLLPKVIIVMM